MTVTSSRYNRVLGVEVSKTAQDGTLSMGGPVGHLLAATNLRECSTRAIMRALERGSVLGAQVTLLHVVEQGPARQSMKLRQRKARELLAEHARSLARQSHNDISINVRAGDPDLEIVREAIELGSDAIVLGLEENVIEDNKAAATAVGVVRDSDTPVLVVVRDPDGPYGCVVVDDGAAISSASFTRAARRLAPESDAYLATPTAADRYSISPTIPLESIETSTEALMDCVFQIGADLLVVGSDRVSQNTIDDPSNFLRQAFIRRCDVLIVREQ